MSGNAAGPVKYSGDFSASSCLVIPAINTEAQGHYQRNGKEKCLQIKPGRLPAYSYVDTKDLQEYQVNGKDRDIGSQCL